MTRIFKKSWKINGIMNFKIYQYSNNFPNSTQLYFLLFPLPWLSHPMIAFIAQVLPAELSWLHVLLEGFFFFNFLQKVIAEWLVDKEIRSLSWWLAYAHFHRETWLADRVLELGSEGLSWDSGLATCQHEALLPSWGGRTTGRALNSEWETRLAFLLTSWVTLLKSFLSSKVGVKSFSPHLLPSSVQSLSRGRLFVSPWTAARQTSLSITNSQSLLTLMSIESVMLSNHLILCHPLLLPSIFPSIRVFPNESVLHIRWPKYWSFSFSISPSNEYSGLIFFSIDWFDLLAVQGTLKSLLQHHSSKVSILWLSAFFIVQLSHPYMTTGKIITLTRHTFVSKVTTAF